MDEIRRETLAALAAIGDPLERARAATEVIKACAQTAADAAVIRRIAIRSLVDAGHRRRQLAVELGIAAPRVTQILNSPRGAAGEHHGRGAAESVGEHHGEHEDAVFVPANVLDRLRDLG